jgi:ATP-dependent helicase IRC3
LILAHRDELVSQAVEKMLQVWPDCPVGVVKAERNETAAQVVVASVQTLSRSARLGQLLAPPTALQGLGSEGSFDLVVVDECHHSTADSYVRILDGLDAGKPGGPLLLGVTATLDRGDGKGLDSIFDEVVADWPILWGIQHGYLCDLRGQRIVIDDLDLSKVKVTAGDYNVGQSGAALLDAGAPQAIAYIVHELAIAEQGRNRTLIFTPTVEVARQTAEAFDFYGTRAAYVSGETPLEERRAILRQFEAGEINALANCAVLTEGYDCPAVDCIVIARPTKSRSLYTQMIGRGTRRAPEKTDCLVLDVVGATDMHSLVRLPTLFGLEKPLEWEQKGEGIAGALMAQAEENARLGRITAEEADLFKVVQANGTTWVAVHDPGAARKRYVRPLRSMDPAVVLAQLEDGTWGAGLRLPRIDETGRGHYGEAGWRTLIRGVTQETAQGVAEEWLRTQTSGFLADREAYWRKTPISDGQRTLAKKLRIDIVKGWKSGDVSDAIDARIAVKNERAANR